MTGAADSQLHKSWTTAYIALGSNMGDREQYLLQAVDALQTDAGIRRIRLSSIYETEPVGYVDQDAFLNMVAEVQTSYGPWELFALMVSIEQKLGRQREIYWGPRTVDLDLLLFGAIHQDDPRLILPHPRMMERAFVLVPLVEVMEHGSSGQADVYAEQLLQAEGKEGVRLWKRTQ